MGDTGRTLTAHERAIAELIGGGHSNEDIAHCLGINKNTLRRDIGTLYRKLGLRGRPQFAVWVSQRRAG